jgi:hypothetical protein
VGQPDAKWRSATRLTLNLGRLAAASKKDPSGECGAARAISTSSRERSGDVESRPAYPQFRHTHLVPSRNGGSWRCGKNTGRMLFV